MDSRLQNIIPKIFYLINNIKIIFYYINYFLDYRINLFYNL